MPMDCSDSARKTFDIEIENLGVANADAKQDWQVRYVTSKRTIHAYIVLSSQDDTFVSFDLYTLPDASGALRIVPKCKRTDSYKHEKRPVQGVVYGLSLRYLANLCWARCATLKAFNALLGPNCHTFANDFIEQDLGVRYDMLRKAKRTSSKAGALLFSLSHSCC